MSLNPLSEVKYGRRLALENLERAERLFKLGDWVGVVSSSQIAVENFAKAVIAVFEVPTWSHDPSEQLKNLIERLPSSLTGIVRELAVIAGEAAPEHGRRKLTLSKRMYREILGIGRRIITGLS